MNGNSTTLLGEDVAGEAGTLDRSDTSENLGHLDLDSHMDLLRRAPVHEVCQRLPDHLAYTPTEHVANSSADV